MKPPLKTIVKMCSYRFVHWTLILKGFGFVNFNTLSIFKINRNSKVTFEWLSVSRNHSRGQNTHGHKIYFTVCILTPFTWWRMSPVPCQPLCGCVVILLHGCAHAHRRRGARTQPPVSSAVLAPEAQVFALPHSSPQFKPRIRELPWGLPSSEFL